MGYEYFFNGQPLSEGEVNRSAGNQTLQGVNGPGPMGGGEVVSLARDLPQTMLRIRPHQLLYQPL